MKRRNVLKTMVAGALPLAALERIANAYPRPPGHPGTHHAPGLRNEPPPVELAHCGGGGGQLGRGHAGRTATGQGAPAPLG